MSIDHHPRASGSPSLDQIIQHSQALRKQSERLRREVRELTEKIERSQIGRRASLVPLADPNALPTDPRRPKP